MKIKFHNPEYPDELEFDVGGLTLVNNRQITLSKEEVDEYEARHGVNLKEHLLLNPLVTIDGQKSEIKMLTPEESVEKEGDK